MMAPTKPPTKTITTSQPLSVSLTRRHLLCKYSNPAVHGSPHQDEPSVSGSSVRGRPQPYPGREQAKAVHAGDTA